MNFYSIRWRLPLSYAAIALLAALSLGSGMLLVLHGYYTGLEREYLSGNAQALQPIVEQILRSTSQPQALQDQVTGFAFLSQARIRIFDAQGQQLADSGNPAANQVVEVSGSPAGLVMFTVPATDIIGNGEIAPTVEMLPSENGDIVVGRTDTVISVSAAPLGGYAFSAEPILTNGQRSSQIVNLPLADGLGNLEISNGPAYGADIVSSVAIAWASAGVLAIALAALVGWSISKQVTQPVLALTEAAKRMEAGNLAMRVELPGEKQQEFTALAHAFNGMAGQVEDTVATLRAFVSDAAHELNTPLTALKTNLELAAAEPDSALRANFLAQALEQNQRLVGLTRSLLDLSRIESAQSAPEFVPFNLRRLVAETGERFASRAEQAGRAFHLTLPENELPILGNAAQLQRALDNLLENALKFTPSGGTITLKLEPAAETVTLTVADTGIGIPPEDLPHLFERFHRGRNSTEYPGNGLGLAIVKAVVNAHNGRIQVESTVGHGTKISIDLHVDAPAHYW